MHDIIIILSIQNNISDFKIISKFCALSKHFNDKRNDNTFRHLMDFCEIHMHDRIIIFSLQNNIS